MLGDGAFRLLASSMNARQFQFYMGTTLQIYEKWAKKNDLPIVIEEIDNSNSESKLLWFGPKRTDRVVLYFHGGGFVIPMQDFAASFWNYVRLQLKLRDLDAGFAVFTYDILPTGGFPNPLTQAVSAVKHVLASGVLPKDLQIVGDSAGGNMAVQLLSHILHPFDGVPLLSLPAPIRGIYLMSPWLSLSGGASGSHLVNDTTDVIGSRTFAYCGRKVLAGVPESSRAYLEAAKAPDGWFEGVERLVDRVLITAGARECLKDDISAFARKFGAHHPGTEFIVQEDGVHNDAYYDFLVRERTNMSNLTPLIVEWLAQGMQKDNR